MTMTDPIADMLTRVRNALSINRAKVLMPASRMKKQIADVLRREGYIDDYELEADGIQGQLVLHLRYTSDGESVIRGLRRESKPGRRLYFKVKEIERVLNGTGIGIYTTPSGVLSDRECRERNVGGEKIATVW